MGEVDPCHYCDLCGLVDSRYDENINVNHDASPKHMCNGILKNFKEIRKGFTGNRGGAVVTCSVSSSFESISHDPMKAITISAKPGEEIAFEFVLENETRKEQLEVVGVGLAHPQPHFKINDNHLEFGNEPYQLKPKSRVDRNVIVAFSNSELGHFQMTIVFNFRNVSNGKRIIIIRDMVVFVEENKVIHDTGKSPYRKGDVIANNFVKMQSQYDYNNDIFRVPKNLKAVFAQKLVVKDHTSEADRALMLEVKLILDTGTGTEQEKNYVQFFHHVLWYEETWAKINLRKYNMAGVVLKRDRQSFELVVPGLAEKRPSLLKGDRIYIRLHDSEDKLFEGNIEHIRDSTVTIIGLDEEFMSIFRPEELFDVRFIMSRVPFERSHRAIHAMQKCHVRVFPKLNLKVPKVKPVEKYFSSQIASNEEQRTAVEHIVAGTSGLAPYMVFGPPGTGKTVTIVEAILQLVAKDSSNRILVCTDSNMAADHIACAILKHKDQLEHIQNLLFRANSQTRVWEVLPAELINYSNGHSYQTYHKLVNSKLATYRIVVTTLLHSAMYTYKKAQEEHQLNMTHLFIDEAGQSSEPSCLIPLTGLLVPTGQLVLAGDPMQLGPVCVSRAAANYGLGVSLMERLKKCCPELYKTEENSNPNYITMLKNNFRSHHDILEIPNKLFYEGQLRTCAKPDPLSDVDVLAGGTQLGRAIVFHAVMSREEKEGKSPSFYNTKEIEMLQKYVRALINVHGVKPEDIGVVTPYYRQMFKVRTWVTEQNYEAIEVGTVEAFQGKEKRVIIITTVRANCKLLDHDAKYQLGFLVDDKRFNVALTRAKSKAIVIGNPTVLRRDIKWCMYMDRCKDHGSYFGSDSQQVDRTAALLRSVAIHGFDRVGITEEMKKLEEKEEKKENKKNKKQKKGAAA